MSDRILPISPHMSKSSHPRRIEVRVPSRDFSAGVETALERLGYDLVPARAGTADPDARIVAAGRLNRLKGGARAPIILFGDRGESMKTSCVIQIRVYRSRRVDCMGLCVLTTGSIELH